MDLIAPSAEVLAGVDGAWGWLSVPERRRAMALVHETDRDDFLAAHILVRQLVGALVGIEGHDVTIVQSCDDCAGAHGAPSVAGMPEVHVSLAHSGGWVAAAAGRQPCGVDVENVDDLRRLGIVGSALDRRERAWVEASDDPVLAFARLWVRKEALVKVGAARLDEVASIGLVGRTGLRDDWEGYRLSGFEHPGHIAIGAVAVGGAVDLQPHPAQAPRPASGSR